VTAVDARPATSAPDPASGAPGAAEQTAVQHVEVQHKLGRRVMDRITDLTGFTSSGLILLAVTVGAWSLGYYVGGRPLYLMAYGGAGVLIASWLYGRRAPDLTGQRSEVQARVREGQSVTVDVSLTAGRRMSTLILEERLPPVLGASPRISIAELAEGDSAGNTYELTCSRRGVYTLGPLVVRWGDPFGLTQRRRTVCDEFEMFVHPRAEPATDRPAARLWEDPPQRPPFSRPWPSGLDFYGMRAYAPGDDVRNVVWRAYARTGSLLVREAEQGVTDKLRLLVDQDVSVHSRGPVSESFETAMRVVASLALHHLKAGYTVTTDGNKERIARPLRGIGRGGIELLDALAQLGPVRSSLLDMLARVESTITNDVELIVVTPRLTLDAILRMRILVDRGVSVRVIALLWDDEALDHLGQGAALGLKVVEIGPTTNSTMALQHEVGGGFR
jgi:uncharacterized protein (DUF58 family)